MDAPRGFVTFSYQSPEEERSKVVPATLSERQCVLIYGYYSFTCRHFWTFCSVYPHKTPTAAAWSRNKRKLSRGIISQRSINFEFKCFNLITIRLILARTDAWLLLFASCCCSLVELINSTSSSLRVRTVVEIQSIIHSLPALHTNRVGPNRHQSTYKEERLSPVD